MPRDVRFNDKCGMRMSFCKMFHQIMAFGFVGILCFFIDFGIYTLLCNAAGVPYLIAGFLGFSISVIVNYTLSMKYVFERRDDMSRMKEFVIFVVLSVIGCGLNELVLYFCIDIIYMRWVAVHEVISQGMANIGGKIVATGIVMVYNFVSRKIALEKRK